MPTPWPRAARIVPGIALLLVCACGGRFNVLHFFSRTPATAGEAARAAFAFAFSGQVLDGATRAPVTFYSVDVIGDDPTVHAVLNPVGDARALFHVGRLPHPTDPPSVTRSLLVWAPGYRATVVPVTVGSDCQWFTCESRGTVSVLLEREPKRGSFAEPFSRYRFADIDARMEAVGNQSLFNEMVREGKLDEVLQATFKRARTHDQMESLLVILDSGPDALGPLLAYLMASPSLERLSALYPLLGGAVPLVPSLRAGAPEIAARLAATKELLPYFRPLIAGGFGGGHARELLSALLDEGGWKDTIAELEEIARTSPRPWARMALAGFPAFASGMLSQGGVGSRNSFEGVLERVFDEPTLTPSLSAHALLDPHLGRVMPYVRNLVQALGGKNGPAIAVLLNEFLDGSNPLSDLKHFPRGPSDLKQYAELVPYLASLVDGLHSPQERALTAFLVPFLNSSDPAAALAELPRSGGALQWARVNAQLYPGAAGVMAEIVPRKQLFAAQLLEGSLGGRLDGAAVLEDLQGLPAVVLTGTARDVFKIAQLPNVRKILRLP